MKIEIALTQIFSEVERAEKLHPDWPTNPIHQAAIVTEEAGELLQASLNHNEHKGSKKTMITEAIHTAASVIRFLKNMQLFAEYNKNDWIKVLRHACICR